MRKRSVIWHLFQKHSYFWWPTLPFKNFSSLQSLCMKFSDLKFGVQKNTFATKKSLKFVSCRLCRGLDPCHFVGLNPFLFFKPTNLSSSAGVMKRRESHGAVISLVWISHVHCKWVTSQMNESRHVWMSHVTYHTFTHTHTRTRTHVCSHALIHACTHARTPSRPPARPRVHPPAYMYTHMHARTHTQHLHSRIYSNQNCWWKLKRHLRTFCANLGQRRVNVCLGVCVCVCMCVCMCVGVCMCVCVLVPADLANHHETNFVVALWCGKTQIVCIQANKHIYTYT